MKNLIQGLTFPLRSLPPHDTSDPSATVAFCRVLEKPAEKILIRYEKMPADFARVMPQDAAHHSQTMAGNIQLKRTSASPGQAGHMRASHAAGTQWSTLSHYLHHRRWIWSIQGSPGLALRLNTVARILSTITKLRLQEGFSFAHSASGIITMLMEVEMEVN